MSKKKSSNRMKDKIRRNSDKKMKGYVYCRNKFSIEIRRCRI